VYIPAVRYLDDFGNFLIFLQPHTSITMKISGLALLATAGSVSAQNATAAAFTDPKTGISFQTYTTKSGAKFGVALPKSGNDKDLIGFLVRTVLEFAPVRAQSQVLTCREHC